MNRIESMEDSKLIFASYSQKRNSARAHLGEFALLCQLFRLIAQIQAARIKALAEMRVGELLKEMQASGKLAEQGRPQEKGNGVLPLLKLDDLGLTKIQSSRFQREAQLPKEKFEAFYRIGRGQGGVR